MTRILTIFFVFGLLNWRIGFAQGQRFAQAFDTITQAQASIVPTIQVQVTTKGRTSAYDEGGGSFYIVQDLGGATNTVDNALIFRSTYNTNYLLKRIINDPTINIKWYGAKGDGVTDDYSAFTNAFANTTFKELLIPAGTYLISSNYLPIPNKQVLKGIGPNSIIKFNHQDYGMDTVVGSTNIVIKDLLFNGPAVQAIRLTSATNVWINNCNFNLFTNIPTVGSTYNSPLYLRNNRNVFIQGNNFYGNGNNGTNFGLGAVTDIVLADQNNSSNVKILNNTFNEFFVDNIINVFTSDDTEIRGNYINQNNYLRPLPATTNDLTSVGYPIVAYAASVNSVIKNVKSLNNFITNSAGSGIYYQGVDYGEIAGNTIWRTVLQQRGTNVPAGGISYNGGLGPNVHDNDIFETSGTTNNAGVAGIVFGTIVTNGTVSRNKVYNSTNINHGIWFRGSGGKGMIVTENQITNSLYGIYPSSFTDSTIALNKINGATIGLFLVSGTNVNVVNNQFNEAVTGIQVYSGDSNNITGNFLRRSTSSGTAVVNAGIKTGVWDNRVVGYSAEFSNTGTTDIRTTYGNQTTTGNSIFGVSTAERIELRDGYIIRGIFANQPIIIEPNGSGYIAFNSSGGTNGIIFYAGDALGTNYTQLRTPLGVFTVVPTGAASTFTGYINASTGYRVAGAATSGYHMRGNGSLITLAAFDAGDIATGTVAPARLGSGVTDPTTYLAGDGTWKTYTPGSGTVTSVGLSLPVSVFSVSGSPVTGSGTLTGSFATQVANVIWAGPASGGAATPTFRLMVGDDIPNGLIVATTKLSATGTKNSSTYLRGDDTWATPPGGGSGVTFDNPSATIGLSAVNGSSTNALRSDAAPALSQAIAPTWTGTHIFRKTSSPVQIQYDSTHLWDITLDSAGTPLNSTTTGTNSFAGIVNPTVGFTINGAANSGYYPRGNGTAIVLSAFDAGDIASGTVNTARLGSGTANSSTYLRGDNTWGMPTGGSGTFFADPTATIGLSANNGSSTNAMRADASPALSQAIVPTWTGTHIFRKTSSPVQIQYDSTHLWDISIDSAGTPLNSTTTGTNSFAGVVNATVGYTVNGSATSGYYMKGDGSKGTFAQLSASDLATGTVPTARLGSGSVDATKFLSGDQTWKTAVTSVNASVPAEFSVSGVPITTTGSIAISKQTQLERTAWMGPVSGGGSAQPTFRTLETSDLPFGAEFVSTGVNVNTGSAGYTTAFSVPTGKSFVLTGVYIVSQSTTSALNSDFWFNIENGSGGEIFPGQNVDHPFTSGKYRPINTITDSAADRALSTDSVRFQIITPLPGTAINIVVYVKGFLF